MYYDDLFFVQFLNCSLCRHRWRFMGLDHLLLWEAIRRTANDRVQPVRHMGAPVVRKDQEVQRPRHLLLPQVQGHTTVWTQKRPVRHHDEEDGRDEEHPPCFCCPLDTCFLWCLQPKQPKLSPGWQLYCQFVGFLLTITTILIYPSLFLYFVSFLWLLWRTGQKATVENHLYVPINSFINWLYCCILCW